MLMKLRAATTAHLVVAGRVELLRHNLEHWRPFPGPELRIPIHGVRWNLGLNVRLIQRWERAICIGNFDPAIFFRQLELVVKLANEKQTTLSLLNCEMRLKYFRKIWIE